MSADVKRNQVMQPARPTTQSPAVLWFCSTIAWGATLLLLAGCSASHYQRSADKDTYSIVQHVEARLFGKTNAFTIDTPYSGRKPTDILPPELIEDRLQTNRRVLSLDAALDLAFSRSRAYQMQKETLYLTALSLTGARHAFSPQFFASSDARVSPTDGGAVVHNQVGMDQLLKSGGSLSLTLANDIINDLLHYYNGDPQRSIISTISVNLAQPLLAGAGMNHPAVEALTQAERNVIYAVRTHAFFQNQFSLEIVNDYFTLLAQKDTIRNRYANYLSRGLSTRRLEAREDREQLAAIDQARQSELSARNTYVNEVARYFTALDLFKIKLGLPLGERIFLDDTALAEVKQVGLLPVPLDPVLGYRLAVRWHLPTLNNIDAFEDTKRKVRLAADALKPGLTFFADASLRSDQPVDYTHFDLKQVRTGIGFNLDLPFERRQERNNYRAALVRFEEQVRDLTLSLDELRDDIEEGLRTVAQRRQNYQIQTNALALANRRVESSTLLQQAGRAEVRDVIEAQDAQISAQNAVTDALVSYQRVRLQLMLDIGALKTVADKFWLKDHLTDFMPGPVPVAATAAAAAEQPVIPPDQLFEK
jgi:outer membrane protein TolC